MTGGSKAVAILLIAAAMAGSGCKGKKDGGGSEATGPAKLEGNDLSVLSTEPTDLTLAGKPVSVSIPKGLKHEALGGDKTHLWMFEDGKSPQLFLSIQFSEALMPDSLDEAAGKTGWSEEPGLFKQEKDGRFVVAVKNDSQTSINLDTWTKMGDSAAECIAAATTTTPMDDATLAVNLAWLDAVCASIASR